MPGAEAPPVPLDEDERLEVLRAYRLLDTEPEQIYDDAVRIASEVCDTPIALISLVDDSRQWFKAKVGLDVTETSRKVSFCAHNLGGDELLVVPDAARDSRFAGNPLVVEEPKIRFYAGAPLRSPEGHGLGSLCVIDREPRELTEVQLETLRALARMVSAQFELRRTSARLADALERARLLGRIVPVCAHCRRIRNDEDYWQELEKYLGAELGTQISHGFCPECVQDHYGELYEDGEAPPG